MMKNKILLSSVTLLSALMVAACGNGEKKTAETAAAPTTEVAKETTAAPTTAAQTTTAKTTTPGSSSGAKEISLADTQRIGNEKLGYINIPKDWVVYTAQNSTAFQYSSPDKYNVILLDSYSKDSVELGPNETFDAQLIANRLYNFWEKDKNQTSIEGVKAKPKFAGEDAFLIKVTFSDGKTVYEWVFKKGEKVYTVAIKGSEDMIKALRPIFEQSFGLDPNTPGK